MRGRVTVKNTFALPRAKVNGGFLNTLIDLPESGNAASGAGGQGADPQRR